MTYHPRTYLLFIAFMLPALGFLASCSQVPIPVRVVTGERVHACANASLVNPFGGGFGGTGAPRMESLAPGGIGGTGQVALQPGLGGTGQIAAEGALGGTGIVGVVTGFASICVNGLKVDFEQGTAVSRDGVAADAGVLAVGQVVALQAVQNGARLRAQRIEVLDSVVGPIAAINLETGRFAVLGQIAQAQETADLAGLSVGDWVRVSGLTRADGEIRATRVLRAEPGMALLRGQVSAKSDHVFMIGSTRVDGQKLPWMGELENGEEVQVQGAWNGMQLNAASGSLQPTQALIRRSREVVLEGYVREIQGQSFAMDYARFMLGSSTSVSGGRADTLRVGQKIQVRGQVGSDLRVMAESIQLLRESGRSEGSQIRTTNGAILSTPAKDGADDDDSSGKGSSNSGSGSSNSGSGSGNSGSGSSNSGSGSSNSGSGSSNSGSGSSNSGSGSGSSGSGSSGKGSSGGSGSSSGSSGSGKGGKD